MWLRRANLAEGDFGKTKTQFCVARESDTLDGGAIEGFSCQVSDIFERIAPNFVPKP
jgi:hypothetical protein